MMKVLRKWKHLALLVVLVAAAAMQPLFVTWSHSTQIVGGVISNAINIGALLVVFEGRWERGLAFVLVTSAFLGEIFHEVVFPRSHLGAIAYHCFAGVFLAFAVAMILKRIFQRRIIGTDDVIGALCGYLLAGAAWGNIYGLVYLIWPSSYRIAEVTAAQLGNWHLQRFLFDYFSIMMLTTLGYDNIAPAGSPVYSLVWLEAVFGQFYIAVVVAQLVGLRLAEAIKGRSGE
jgi:voltage-gated potassium channel